MTDEPAFDTGATLPDGWRPIADYDREPADGDFPALALLVDAKGDLILGGWHRGAWRVFFDGDYGKPAAFEPVGWSVPSPDIIEAMSAV